jgi:hypothetical protein
MSIRHASCSCGQLTATTDDDPVPISICHCLACQRRTGGPFAEQARFVRADVTVSGQSTSYIRTGDEGTSAGFHFCPVCGATVFYAPVDCEIWIAIPVAHSRIRRFPSPQCRPTKKVCIAGSCRRQAPSAFRNQRTWPYPHSLPLASAEARVITSVKVSSRLAAASCCMQKIFASATCYADSTGWIRPEAAVQALTLNPAWTYFFLLRNLNNAASMSTLPSETRPLYGI